jgi:hypothetical protein
MRVTQPQQTQLYRLIEERLDGTLAEFIAARWPGSGWRKIADEITELTQITVSYATLRLWFADRIDVETKVTVR